MSLFSSSIALLIVILTISLRSVSPSLKVILAVVDLLLISSRLSGAVYLNMARPALFVTADELLIEPNALGIVVICTVFPDSPIPKLFTISIEISLLSPAFLTTIEVGF